MRYWTPPRDGADDPSWWRPLATLAELLAVVPDVPMIVPCDFRLVGRVERPGRAAIWQHRHRTTGRFLHIDDALVVYRERVTGRLVRDRGGWRSALARLELAVADRPDPRGHCGQCRALLARRERARDGPLAGRPGGPDRAPAPEPRPAHPAAVR